MNKWIKYPLIVVTAVFLGSYWTFLAKIMRPPEVSLPKALTLVFAGGAFWMGVFYLVFERSIPRLSMKAFHSAVSLATLYFVLPGFLVAHAMKSLPPLVGAMGIGLVPLWFWMFRMGIGKYRPIFLAVGVSAITMFFLGSVARYTLRWDESIALILLFASTGFMASGIMVSKKLMWIHSAVELNFWSLAFAAVIVGVTSIVVGGTGAWYGDGPHALWWLVGIGFITGLGSFLYRHVAFLTSELQGVFITLSIPMVAAASNAYYFPTETPLTKFSLIGIVVYLAAMAWASRTETHSFWLVHSLTNSRRQGDRVVCHIGGFMQKGQGAMAKIEVVDLSIGGLGFRSDSPFTVSDVVTASFPLAKTWSQVAMECRIVHLVKSSHPTMPWTGGAQFSKLDDDTLQILVEFLARIGHISEAA